MCKKQWGLGSLFRGVPLFSPLSLKSLSSIPEDSLGNVKSCTGLPQIWAASDLGCLQKQAGGFSMHGNSQVCHCWGDQSTRRTASCRSQHRPAYTPNVGQSNSRVSQARQGLTGPSQKLWIANKSYQYASGLSPEISKTDSRFFWAPQNQNV